MPRRLLRYLFDLFTHADGRFYAAGSLGVALGVGLMATPAVLTWSRPALAAAYPWGGNVLLFVGQVVASFSGVLFGVPLMRRRRREASMKAGLCPSCGYDLTGNVSGTCPECGAGAPSPRPS